MVDFFKSAQFARKFYSSLAALESGGMLWIRYAHFQIRKGDSLHLFKITFASAPATFLFILRTRYAKTAANIRFYKIALRVLSLRNCKQKLIHNIIKAKTHLIQFSPFPNHPVNFHLLFHSFQCDFESAPANFL